MQQRFLSAYKLPADAIRGEGYQSYIRLQMHTAEKDLAHALAIGPRVRSGDAVAGLVSQDMARIYQVVDAGRR